MKIINIILTLLLFSSAFGQEIPKKEGCIEIMKIRHSFLDNDKGEQTKEISNKANKPYLILYLDSLGNLIEKVGYGKYHNPDLRVLDFVEQNIFENGRLESTVHYHTDYNKNINAKYRTIYSYDNSNQLIQQKMLYFETDSLFLQYDFEYDNNGNKTKIIFSPREYYIRTFDEKSNLQSIQQINNNKLQWERTFSYTDKTIIKDLKTYYDSDRDYTKQEISTFKNGKLTKIQDGYTNRDGLSNKTVFHYNQRGLLKKIDYFVSYSSYWKYQLKSYTEIKIKYCKKLTPTLIKKINEVIMNE